jgi:predicted phage tail protein
MEASSIKEAVEGFSRQVDWPKDLRVDIVGYRDEHKLLTERPDEINIMPSLHGGGGKFGQIIMGAVVVAIGAVVFFTLSPTVGISLMISGGMMMAQGVVGLFFKSPKMDKSVDPEDSKYLGINRNTTAARTPITMAWGRVNLYPHWLSLQSDSNQLSHGAFPVTP